MSDVVDTFSQKKCFLFQVSRRRQLSAIYFPYSKVVVCLIQPMRIVSETVKESFHRRVVD